MKHILVIILSAVCTVAMAQSIGKERARDIAVSFAIEKGMAKSHDNSPVNITKMTGKNRLADFDNAAFHVFNFGNDGGFVIVSDDSRAPEVLGYSDKGHVTPDNMPTQMAEWLNGYDQQMKQLAAMSDAEAMKQTAQSRHNATATRNSISPLITTLWDQATPYWNLCPNFGTDEEPDLAYTGCVATALSQIMNYHKYPETSATIPAYDATYPTTENGWDVVKPITYDALPPVTFDWQHMRDSYTGGEDEQSVKAVATLMQYAGHAVKMEYSTIGSSANDPNVVEALKNCFGYDQNVQLVYREDYDQKTWEDMIYNELAAGRPTMYSGRSNGSGHSFVCDGYEYGGYFHFNWGWSGMGNGYFLMTILNPNSSGIGGSASSAGYTAKQAAIIGIKPATQSGSTEADFRLSAVSITASSSYSRDGVNYDFRVTGRKQIKVSTYNHTGESRRFKQGLALYDGEEFVKMIAEDNVASLITAGTNTYTDRFPFGSNNSDYFAFGKGMTGTYRIVPMCQLNGEGEWKPDLQASKVYLEVNMTNTEMTVKAHPIVNLKATGFDFRGNMKVGSTQDVDVSITNNSADDFQGLLYLHVGDDIIDDYTRYSSSTSAQISSGETQKVTFTFMPQTQGSKQVYITLDENGYETVSGNATATFAASQTGTLDFNVDVSVKDAIADPTSKTDGMVYDNCATFQMTVTNNGTGEYNNSLLAPLFLVSFDSEGNRTGASMVTYKQQEVNIMPGETKTVEFTFDNLGYDEVYSANLYYRNESGSLANAVKAGGSKFFTICRGIVTWAADGTRRGVKATENISVSDDAVAVMINTQSPLATTITPNSNPNCIYFIGEDEEVPSGLENSNIVKGNQSDRISLKDNYDFFTPFKINATEITYTRQFDIARTDDTNGWTTVCLPFSPTAVEDASAGRQLQWFGSEDETGKDIWLLEFSREEDDGTATFTIAKQLEANIPYVIAVGDGAWKSTDDLRGKDIVFKANDVTINPNSSAMTSGQQLLFTGTLTKQSLTNILTMNSQGTYFEKGYGEVLPFRAYFNVIPPSELPERIYINEEAITDGINIPSTENRHDIYSITGIKVGTSDMMPTAPGVYIINGKKYVLRGQQIK